MENCIPDHFLVTAVATQKTLNRFKLRIGEIK